MRFFSSLILVFLFFSLAHAQTVDSLFLHYDSLRKSKLSTFDSTNTRINKKIDSLQLRASSILEPRFSTENMFQRPRERQVALTNTLEASLELDSIKGRLQPKIDSLSKLHLPVDKYERELDSISQFSPQNYMDQVNGKVGEWQAKINKPTDDLENKVNKPINDLEAKVNEKLVLMSREGGGAANIPAPTNLKNVDLPSSAEAFHAGEPRADFKTGDLPLNAGLNLKASGVDDLKNQLGDIDNPFAGEMEQLDALKEKVVTTAVGIKDIPQQQIDRLRSVDEVEAIQGKARQANALIDKAQGYQQDISRIANGDLSRVEEIPKAIENRIASMEDMQELQKQTAEVTKYQEMLAKGNDPDALRGMAKEAAVKYAIDHFAAQQEALQGAIDKMSKLGSKYSQVSSLKNLPQRVPNPVKGKAFIERLVPGLVFQIQKSKTFMLDLNPTIAWRATGRFTAGAGWNERLSFDKWNHVVAQDRIYGPRGFTSFAFRKGFSLNAEVEKMNTFLPNLVGATEGGRAWVWSVFGGFKKEYTFNKKIKGNVQVLYNLYDDHDNSPYMDRINVRMGWEIGLNKRRKG